MFEGFIKLRRKKVMDKNITPKERIMSALKREFADRIPVTAALGAYGAKLLGYTMKDFYADPVKQTQSIIKAYETFQPDTVPGVLAPMVSAEAIKCEIEFTEFGQPHVKKRSLENKADLLQLNLPDPQKMEHLPAFLEVCGQLTSQIKDAPVGATVEGPWTMGVSMRGAEELIYDAMDDPNFVHELMRFNTEVCKIAIAAVRTTGVGITLADPAAGCSLISPTMYRQFVKPYHEEIIRHFKEKRTMIAVHICGYIDPIMEDLVSIGVGSISLDGPSSLEKMVELGQKRVLIVGNVPTELFLEGTKGQIEKAVKDCIKIAAKGSGYILCSGCEVPFNSPIENVQHYMAAGKEYGRAEIVKAL